MEVNVYHRKDYGGYWRRSFGDSLDGIFLGIILGIFKAAPEGVASILGILTSLAYLIGFKAYGGNATPGYWILGMKIVAINSEEVSVRQIVIRLISSVFSALAFTLGFIWIAFDKNKQAWHDKIAGTYVIKSHTEPIRTLQIPQTGLIRTKWFILVVLLSVGFIIGFAGWLWMDLVERSGAYQTAEQYSVKNRWIRQEIGDSVKIGRFPRPPLSADLGHAYFTRRVVGEKGAINVTFGMVRKGTLWVVVQAGYTDDEGKYIDITKRFLTDNANDEITRAPELVFFQPDILWTKFYGGDIISVLQTSDGGYILTGRTGYRAGEIDVLLIKTNASGDALWTRTYRGSNAVRGLSVQQTNDGGYILGTTYAVGGEDFWLIKTDSLGNTLWTRTYGGSNTDRGRSAQQTKDGGYIIGGETYYSPGGNALLVKTNVSGDTLWTRTYGGNDWDRAHFVQQTSDEGYIVTGFTRSYSSGSYDVWLIKTNASGDTLWTKAYGGSREDIGDFVQQTSDGGYIITGSTESYGAGSFDVWLIKTNASGDTLWTKTFGGSSNDFGRSVHQTSDGGYIIAAGSYGLLKTDAFGNTQWTLTFEGGAAFAQQTSDGGYIVAGGSMGSLIRVAPDTGEVSRIN